jgi:hypothetical protein
MSLVDFMEVWWLSIQPLLQAAGVAAHFNRSPIDRPKPSCSLNLRRNKVEADLVVWESGEAELATVDRDGSTKQQHFDDLRIPRELSVVLSDMISLVS